MGGSQGVKKKKGVIENPELNQKWVSLRQEGTKLPSTSKIRFSVTSQKKDQRGDLYLVVDKWKMFFFIYFNLWFATFPSQSYIFLKQS